MLSDFQNEFHQQAKLFLNVTSLLQDQPSSKCCYYLSNTAKTKLVTSAKVEKDYSLKQLH